MKELRSLRFLLSTSAFLLLAGCGTFDASYTDPATGHTYYGGVRAPAAVADNK